MVAGMSHSSYLTFAMKVTKAAKITIVCDPATDADGRGPGAGLNEPWKRVGDMDIPLGDTFGNDAAVVVMLSERDEAKVTKDYKHADVSKNEDFVLFKTMNFVSKTRNCVLITRNCCIQND